MQADSAPVAAPPRHGAPHTQIHRYSGGDNPPPVEAPLSLDDDEYRTAGDNSGWRPGGARPNLGAPVALRRAASMALQRQEGAKSGRGSVRVCHRASLHGRKHPTVCSGHRNGAAGRRGLGSEPSPIQCHAHHGLDSIVGGRQAGPCPGLPGGYPGWVGQGWLRGPSTGPAACRRSLARSKCVPQPRGAVDDRLYGRAGHAGGLPAAHWGGWSQLFRHAT